jgi:hypothetical protein
MNEGFAATEEDLAEKSVIKCGIDCSVVSADLKI